MASLPFNMGLMEYLAEHRSVPLTAIFLAFTFLGETEGYVLVAALIYVVWDKRLAVRLSMLVLLTMSLNHVMKIIVRNPRPFIDGGNYLDKWAVSAAKAQELAAEYSTPSGHAMAGAAFYSYLYASVRNSYIRVFAIAAIVLTGLSRAYLGVHYLEDVLIGWAIGLMVALLALKYTDAIGARWSRLSHAQQIGLTVGGSLVLWLLTIAIDGWRIDGQPRAFVGYAGSLTGIVIARRLELRLVNFDPRSLGAVCKVARYIVTVGLTLLTLFSLGKVFRAMADEFSMIGYLLQYVRYTIAGVVCFLGAPWVFTKLRLAEPVSD